MTYHVGEANFQPAPAGLLQTCPSLINPRWTRTMWVYGELRREDEIYLVIGGMFVPRGPAHAAPLTDPQGAIVDIAGTDCKLLGPAREVLQYPEDLLTPSVLHGLADDIVRRYRAAFGGAARLDAILHAQRVRLGDPRDAALRSALAGHPN